MKAWASYRIPDRVLDEAVRQAAWNHGVRPREVLMGERSRLIDRARQYAMWTLRKATKANGEPAYGFIEIGRRFKRDHTSAMAAYRRIEAIKALEVVAE